MDDDKKPQRKRGASDRFRRAIGKQRHGFRSRLLRESVLMKGYGR